jgi:hypothetical protein
MLEKTERGQTKRPFRDIYNIGHKTMNELKQSKKYKKTQQIQKMGNTDPTNKLVYCAAQER